MKFCPSSFFFSIRAVSIIRRFAVPVSFFLMILSLLVLPLAFLSFFSLTTFSFVLSFLCLTFFFLSKQAPSPLAYPPERGGSYGVGMFGYGAR